MTKITHPEQHPDDEPYQYRLEEEVHAHHTPVAIMILSGTYALVGVHHEPDKDVIYFKIDDGEETYMSVAQAKLLVAGFKTAIDNVEYGN